ncbi:MAG: hypothetical protein K8S54_09590 [Spirochaetia bacterium]|nr:hypothetical protein [Spirochaetia bacterium]
MTLQGVVTTFTGPPQGTTTAGDIDGAGSNSRWNLPKAITTDGISLYVADTGNNKIRKIDIRSGFVTVFAGPPPGITTSGDADGVGTAARFNGPSGITTDGINLYVSDRTNNKIRKIVIETGLVTTFAGPASGSLTPGDTDGIGNAAGFNLPSGLTTDGTYLYVADFNNEKIRRIELSTGSVTTIGGAPPGSSPPGDTDAIGTASRFLNPTDLTTDGNSLYIAEGNQKIRQMVLVSGLVSTLAGPPPGFSPGGDADGVGNAARFNTPSGIATDGTNLYVCDTANNKLRQITISSGAVSTLAGPGPDITTPGDIDARGNAARFNGPFGITSDGQYLYVVDRLNNKVRRIQ